MIEIRVRQDDGFSIDIKGHAGYKPGNDIVCSAASILTQTLAQKLWEMEAEGKLIRLSMNVAPIRPGDFNAEAVPKKQYAEMLEHITDTILTGFQMLYLSFPDNFTYLNSEPKRRYVPPDTT